MNMTARGLICVAALTAQLNAQAICNSSESWCTFLKQQDSLGLAAGNAGDYYHNADSLHANAGNATCPQVTLLPVTRGAVYSTDSTKVVVGNASLAYTTLPGQVSLVRYGLMSQSGAASVYRQYTHNNAYWYPEHRDHDSDGGGDRFHAMTPCVSNSQGSSGSELDEVRKFFWTLAAFRPAVKTLLRDENLLMPTIQMIMRRTRAADDEGYLNGAVHANAYDNASNALAMVQLANEMLPANVPAMVRLRVVGDDFETADRLRTFGINTLQRWYDTPASVCRVWRDFEHVHEMVVSADSSYDVNGRPLTFEWRLLRGDPARVRIVPLSADNKTVRIEFDHANGDTIPGTPLFSSLAVVGAFAHNGVYYSAPAFVTAYSLPNQVRRYDTARGAPLDVAYRDFYLLESLDYNRSWQRDTFFCWSGTPVVSGWTRYAGAASYEFTANGRLVGERDGAGHVSRAQLVSYSTRDTLSRRRMVWSTSGAMADFDGAPPAPPTNVVALNLSGALVRVNWGAPQDSTVAPAAASGVAGYRVEVSTSSSFDEVVKRWNCRDVGSTAACTLDGLAGLTQYYVRVRAYDTNLNLSPPSVEESFTTGSGAVSRVAVHSRMPLRPVVRVVGGVVRFVGLPAEATVELSDIAGRAVGAGRLASGVYQYRVRMPGAVPLSGVVQVLR